MSHTNQRFMGLCTAFVVCALLSACAGDDAAPSSDPPVEPDERVPDKKSTKAEPAEPIEDEAAAPSEDEPAGQAGAAASDVEPPAGVETVQDRCVGPSCGRSELPEQPDLLFLEDMGGGWKRLMELDWAMAGSAEGYRCKTFTIPEDVYVVEFDHQVPRGTHHVAFGVSDDTMVRVPDDVFACDVGGRGARALQPAGAGEDPIALPPGVAMPIPAGQQVFMNLHVFNANEEPLTGRSGVWVKTIPKEMVEQEAEVVLVGPLELDIPIGRSKTASSCAVRSDSTVYGIAPHMHFTGVHARASVTNASGEETVLHDGPFDPYEHAYYALDGLELKVGDKMNVECTFENTGDHPLKWGDSALEEMCFINFSVYPALPYGGGPCTE
jgi:hypothetical protein